MESGKHYRQVIGKQGEDMACRFLEENGHTILERNWRCGHLEIDIISLDKDGIHFVEVKTRRQNIQAPPQENVNYIKQNRIIKAALRYLKSGKGMNFGNSECSFDIIGISIHGNDIEITWIPQAYIPIYI